MPSSDPRSPLVLSLARAGGRTLAGVVRGVAAARSTAKPLHPEGGVVRARLVRHGLDQPTGVPWLDGPGRDEALLRWSRAIGTPASAPDIHGLAVRVSSSDQSYGDLLFATTGWSPMVRAVLLPGRSAQRPMTTLLPYTTPSGALVLGARPDGDVIRLYVASPLSAWREFAEIRQHGPALADQPISFDPVRNAVPGLEFPAWVTRLRAPAYRIARRSRRS